MLSVAPGSSCDVCLDSFGLDDKAPCSIQCGHVFCEACLNHINRSSCPLCRMPFDQRTIIKLHVDLDSSSPATSPGPGARQEARRLQVAIASVANEGTTEPRLRQLIAEATAFLAAQPRDLFSDLRISHRMLAHLCDIKAKVRSQKADLEKLSTEACQLKDENGDLQQQIDHLNTIRKDEKETALAVEMSLRDHCSRAHATYAQLADRHAYVVGQWTALTSKIGSLDVSEPPALNAMLDIQGVDMCFLTSDIAYPFSHDNKEANSNPDSLLISPLPQFTSRLPASFSDLRPLPDVGSDPETLLGHSAPCTSSEQLPRLCIETSPFPKALPFVNSARNRSASLIEKPADSESRRRNDLPPLPDTTVSPNDHDMVNYRISSSSSRSSRTSSRSRPPAQFVSRPSSPRRSVSSLQAQSRIPSPLDGSLSASVVPPVINRLHDLMGASSVSSSLPNMSNNHFPTSLTHSSHRGLRHSRSPSRSRSTSLHTPPHPVTQHNRGTHSDAVSSIEPASIVVKPPSYDPPLSSAPVVSSASTAALVLEKAQREQRERQRAEKEQERERRRVDNESEGLEKEREKSERDRSRIDVERVRGQTPAATSHSPYREPTKVYSNVPVASEYSYRNHSNGLGSSGLRDPYNAYIQTTRALPVLPKTRA